MRADKMVWVELRPIVVRIFRSRKASIAASRRIPCGNIVLKKYGDAVGELRHTLFLRSQGNCEQCNSPINEKGSHMHERKHRGKGGEISLGNSILVCAACHDFDHRDRKPKFRRRKI